MGGYDVLIPVLMEYPLTKGNYNVDQKTECLNPCSNGIPSDSIQRQIVWTIQVLIPVLMEYPLTWQQIWKC